MLASLIETEPGIWTRPGTDNNTPSIAAHYREDAHSILKRDLLHYDKLISSLAKRDPDLMEQGRLNVCAIGGGHPKLESYFTRRTIRVLDQFAGDYRQSHSAFSDLYYPAARVIYEADRLAPENHWAVPGETTTFVHFLEHQTPEQIRDWLRCASGEVIIYGPNIARGLAMGAGWFHFIPVDHITFVGFEAMARLLEEAGFCIVVAFPFSDDYYFRAVRV